MNDQIRYNTRLKDKQAVKKQARTSAGMICRHCGATVPREAELCPECKHPLHNDHCTFCGSAVFPDDKFCPECGSPIDGIRCPKCGAMNFRGFCYRCHEPLTENAQAQVALAQADPLFKQAQKLATQIAEMINQMDEAKDSQKETMKDENAALIDSYKNLLQSLNNGQCDMKDIHQINQHQAESAQTGHIDLSDCMTEIKQKVHDLNRIMKSFEPDEHATPQVQRDYYSARKVKIATKHTEFVTSGWKCNFCGCVHNNPEECDKPKLGGEWRYREIEVKDINWMKQ